MQYDSLMLLLQSICINYPVLTAWGYSLDRPIGLVFSDQEEVYSYARYLSGNPKILTITDRLENIRNVLQKANSEGVFFIMPDMCKYKIGNNIMKINEVLYSAKKMDSVAAVFMVFHKFVPCEYKNQILEIHVDKTRSPVVTLSSVFDLIPESAQLEVVKDKIVNLGMTNKKARELYAAAAFLYPKLLEFKGIGIYDKVVEIADEIGILAASYRMEDSVSDFLIDLLYVPFMRHEIEIIKLPDLTKGQLSRIKSVAFIRDNNFYISEELFEKIFEPAIQKLGSNQVKSCLRQSEILMVDGMDSGYTTLMSYITGDNRRWYRKRMLKLDSNRVPSRYGLQFINLL